MHSHDNKEKNMRIRSFIDHSPVSVPSAYLLNYPSHCSNKAKHIHLTTNNTGASMSYRLKCPRPGGPTGTVTGRALLSQGWDSGGRRWGFRSSHREVLFFASQRKAATPEVMPRFITKPYIEQRGYGFLFTTPPPPRTTIPNQRHIYNKSII